MSIPREPEVSCASGPRVAFGRRGSPVPCHCRVAGGGLRDVGTPSCENCNLLLAPPGLSKAANTQNTPNVELRM